MDIALLKIRVRKLAVALAHPTCWRALCYGVAPTVEHLALLASLKIDGILDVGANRGQFSLACRLAQPHVPIAAFEPIPAEAAMFRKVHGTQSQVILIETALGQSKGDATMHLSKSADSSSLLPIGKKQIELFGNTVEVGTIKVQVHRLDDFADYWTGRTRQLLKLDVQGYELNVLRGAAEALKSCVYVYAECSEVALYDGQALRVDVQAFLAQHGFVMNGRYNEQLDGNELVQADYLFIRER